MQSKDQPHTYRRRIGRVGEFAASDPRRQSLMYPVHDVSAQTDGRNPRSRWTRPQQQALRIVALDRQATAVSEVACGVCTAVRKAGRYDCLREDLSSTGFKKVGELKMHSDWGRKNVGDVLVSPLAARLPWCTLINHPLVRC